MNNSLLHFGGVGKTICHNLQDKLLVGFLLNKECVFKKTFQLSKDIAFVKIKHEISTLKFPPASWEQI